MLMAIAFASILNSNASDEAGGLRASDAERRVVAYVTSYSDVRPSAFDITNINYAFGSVNETFDGVDISNPERLKDIVTLKRENPNLEVELYRRPVDASLSCFWYVWNRHGSPLCL